MWLSGARQNSHNPNLVIFMIGNKADLNESREVSFEEGLQFATANDLVFLELTAKCYDQVEDAFLQTAEKILHKIQLHGRALSKGLKLKGASKLASKDPKSVADVSFKVFESTKCCT